MLSVTLYVVELSIYEEHILASNKGLVIILSGPSGVGKDTLIDKWTTMNRNLARLVTCTTREQRPGERIGVDYHFISEDEFDRMIERNAFLEYKKVMSCHYGSPLEDLQRMSAMGRDVILKIDVQGALEVKTKLPEAVMIFVQPPSLAVLEERLRSRSTENEDQMQLRLKTALKEIDEIPNYDYLVTNDIVDRAVHTLNSILVAEHSRVGRSRSIVSG